MHMKPERELSVFDDSLDLNAFLLLLWFIVLFENETGSSVTVSSFLNPKGSSPCSTSLAQLQELHFHCLCVCELLILPALNTATTLCFLLTCQKSHKELKDTQGLTLMVQLLTIGWCVKSEWLLHGLALWGGLGAGWALEPGCRGADRCWHQSQAAALGVAFWPLCGL